MFAVATCLIIAVEFLQLPRDILDISEWYSSATGISEGFMTLLIIFGLMALALYAVKPARRKSGSFF